MVFFTLQVIIGQSRIHTVVLFHRLFPKFLDYEKIPRNIRDDLTKQSEDDGSKLHCIYSRKDLSVSGNPIGWKICEKSCSIEVGYFPLLPG